MSRASHMCRGKDVQQIADAMRREKRYARSVRRTAVGASNRQEFVDQARASRQWQRALARQLRKRVRAGETFDRWWTRTPRRPR